MKKNLLLIGFVLMSFAPASAFVAITSLAIIPATPADTQHVYAAVGSEFGAGSCLLLGSIFYLQNDTVYLFVSYDTGMLSVICDRADTFDLGILPCTAHVLSVVATATGGSPGTDASVHPLNIICTPLNVPDTHKERVLFVFPNPATEELFVKTNGDNSQVLEISILNPVGEKVYSSMSLQKENLWLRKINISDLSNGIYFIKVETVDGVTVKRFLKEE